MANSKLSILVVDDSTLIRTSMIEELSTLGYPNYSASSVEEAEKILKEKNIDLVLLDLMLPGMSGMEYLEKLKNQKEDIIVIIMTAYESVETAVNAIERGAYDYVIKPVEPSHLELIIKRALKRYQITQEKKNAIERRVQALTDFMETTKETYQILQGLKKEVNDLLKELGQPAKYKTIE